MLTRKQHELLMFIRDRLATEGISPSFEEMKLALGLRSKSGIHRLITSLEDRGFLRRLQHKARALEIIRMPESTALQAKPNKPITENVIEGNFRQDFNQTPDHQESTDRISDNNNKLPFLGKIAAGIPIEALNNPTESIDVPPNFLTPSGAHYALEVEGDSMVEVGILDGDIAVVKDSDTAEDGAIVVALVDDQEATLKRLRRRGSSVALEAANSNYETRIFGPGRVKVQGRLVGILRRYK